LTTHHTPIALCIHGHFYQPPRENPWTDRVPREPSAAPFHDWNARIHAECYRANAYARIHDHEGRIQGIVDNYERISFNFGPTLARWLGRHDPDVHSRLRAADTAQLRASGHGGAVAQAYAHPIVPLCNAADRRTHLSWGLADFRRRFGRDAEGLWLPETAASPDTLETMIELGVRYTILAPEQIAAVRASPRDEWQQVDRDSVDTGRAYLWRHRDGSGRTIAIGVFDGPLSRAIAFGDTANRAESLIDAVKGSADRSQVHGQRLVLCTSDGELWGHHKKFADLTLSFATRVEAARRGIETTNLGAYLARHPPVWEMQLAEGPDGEGTAWSCGHGVGRWRRDCGCNMGGPHAGNQKWRGPLRAALDIIRDAAAALYEDAAGELFDDPWRARDDYGAVVDDPPDVRDRALAKHARRRWKASAEARLQARKLLELQRTTLLMYASCGWFFDDIAGLEGALVLRLGAHALHQMGELGARAPTAKVLAVLAEARSNHADQGTGADVMRRGAQDRITVSHAVAGAALAAAVGAPPVNVGWDVALSVPATRKRDAGSLTGSALATNRRTGAVEKLSFVVNARQPWALEVKLAGGKLTVDKLDAETRATLMMASLPALVDGVRKPNVAQMIVDAARELPPDGESAEGVTRRTQLTAVLLALISGKGGAPTADMLHAAAELYTIVDLPPGARDRRVLEEHIWTLLERGRPSAALRALADKVGFATKHHVS